MRFGLLLIGGVIVVTGVAATGLVGLALLSVTAEAVGSSAGGLVSCAPTLPPDEEEGEEDSNSNEQSSDT